MTLKERTLPEREQDRAAVARSGASTPPVTRRLLGALRGLLLSEYFILLLTIAFFLICLPFLPRLASPGILTNMLSNMWPLLTVAIGQTFVLIAAGIDLSQTSTLAMTSVIGAVVMSQKVNPTLFEKSPLWGSILTPEGGILRGSELATPVGILVMLVVGAGIGWLNGTAVARLKMPPFMVTLVTLGFFSAFAIYLTKSENLTGLPPAFLAFGKSSPDSILSLAMIVAVGLAIVAQFILSRTVYGRWLYAVGTNPRTANVSGVPTQRVIVLAYVFSGFCAALGSVLYSARLEAGRPTLGQNMLLDVVGATVIGGTSLFGGKGKILWTVFGVMFFVLLATTLRLFQISTFEIDIAKGGVILLAALFDVTRTRFVARN